MRDIVSLDVNNDSGRECPRWLKAWWLSLRRSRDHDALAQGIHQSWLCAAYSLISTRTACGVFPFHA